VVYGFQRGSKNLSVVFFCLQHRKAVGDIIIVHGLRSSFQDRAADETNFPREVAEAALAHVIGDKAEQAYRRGDALEKRRALMEAWSGYLRANLI